MAASETEKFDIYKDITDRLLAAYESGPHEWSKSWAGAGGLPINPTTGKPYTGHNCMLLLIQGRPNKHWLTFNQGKEIGANVRKGEQGVRLYRLVEKEIKEEKKNGEEETKTIPVLKGFTVFNVDQFDNLPEHLRSAERNADFKPNERAEALADALVIRTGLTIDYGKGDPCYIPSVDKVVMPAREAFDDESHFYTTLMHECGHSTLAKNRLDRSEALGRFGSERYAREELRVELASAFLAAETGVPLSEKHVESHAAYLQSWAKALRDDKKEVMRACKDAYAICNYIVTNEAEFRKSMTATAAKTGTVEKTQTATKERTATTQAETAMAFRQ